MVMVLPEGTILEGRYVVGGMLAEGGMGAIYRGYDTKLDIEVALKENFFQTPESIQQFEQEARILARLHHPNLPRVIDHFTFDGKQYLVMDYVDGLDLWELFKTRKDPLEEADALDYIIQVCDAVAYLHRQTPPIIHRDIKPQNIKVTSDGRAVLVDFGIAKMVGSGDRTRTGAMAITPGFSPPEQYGGMGTGPVSDIYSLGATLYAILTGQYPPDSISLMAGGATFQPPNTINAKLSQQVSRAVERAMQVKREDRPQAIAAWQQELKAIREGLDTRLPEEGSTIILPPLATQLSPPDPVTIPVPPLNPHPPANNPPWLWIGIAVAALVVATGLFTYLLARSGNPEPTVDTQAILLALIATATAQAQAGTIEPEVNFEATLVALAATATAQTLVQPASEPSPPAPTETPEPTASPIPPTETPTQEPAPTATATAAGLLPTAAAPSSTPAPGRLAFVSNRTGSTEIYVMRLDGSQQIGLTNNPTMLDEFPTWSPDGQRLAFGSSNAAERRTAANTTLLSVDVQGGDTATLTTQADQPAWSPDGQSIVIAGVDNHLFVIDVETGESTQLTQGRGFRPAWSPDGQQVVFDDNSDLYIINRDGSGLSRLTGSVADETQPAWSPDGQLIAFVSTGDGNNEIYLIKPDGTSGLRLTNNPANDQGPAWSPDGAQIAFASDRDGQWEIYVMGADGRNPTNLTQHPGNDIQPAWSP